MNDYCRVNTGENRNKAILDIVYHLLTGIIIREAYYGKKESQREDKF